MKNVFSRFLTTGLLWMAVCLAPVLLVPSAQAAALSDYAENKLVDWFFRAQAIGITGASAAAGTGPTTLYIGLFTVAPTDSTSGTEVSGGSYARVSVTSSLANWAGTQAAASTTASTGTSGTTSNNNVITFPTPSAGWGTVVSACASDASSAGNQLFCMALTSSQTINTGNTVTFPAGTLTFQFDN